MTDDLLRRHQPAEAHTGAHRLGKGAGVDRQPIWVERIDGRDFFAREAQIVIGIVFENDRSELMRQLDELLALFERHRNTGGVLEIGNHIDHFRGDAASAQFFQLRAERVHVHPVVFHRNGDLVGANVLQRPDETHPGRRFHEHGIAPIDEKIDDQPDRLRTASGNHHVGRCGDDTLIARQLFAQDLDQRLSAHRGAILQRPTAIRFERAYGGLSYRFGWQRFRIRKPIDERDHLGRLGWISHPRRREISPPLRIEIVERLCLRQNHCDRSPLNRAANSCNCTGHTIQPIRADRRSDDPPTWDQFGRDSSVLDARIQTGGASGASISTQGQMQQR